MNREEIREGLNELIGNCLIEIGCGEGSCPKAEMKALEAQETLLDEVLKFLDSKDVRRVLYSDSRWPLHIERLIEDA